MFKKFARIFGTAGGALTLLPWLVLIAKCAYDISLPATNFYSMDGRGYAYALYNYKPRTRPHRYRRVCRKLPRGQKAHTGGRDDDRVGRAHHQLVALVCVPVSVCGAFAGGARCFSHGCSFCRS